MVSVCSRASTSRGQNKGLLSHDRRKYRKLSEPPEQNTPTLGMILTANKILNRAISGGDSVQDQRADVREIFAMRAIMNDKGTAPVLYRI